MILYSNWFVCFLLGCPTPGYYGENCSLYCPRNCQEGHCNIVDGTCLGCVGGYSGQYCNDGNYVSSEMLYISLLTYRIKVPTPSQSSL